MPGAYPNLEDVSATNVQGARPVAAIDPSGYGRGTQALAKGVQSLGGDITKSADDIAAEQIEVHKRTVDNALTDLSTSYINNRNQFGLSNDPNDIANWQTANQDARTRFNTATGGVTPALAQHAQSRAGMMDAEEGFRVHTRGHEIQSSQAEADTLQESENLAGSVKSYDMSGRPDPTRTAQIQGMHSRIDERERQGLMSPLKAEQYRQHFVTKYGDATLTALINSAGAEQDPVKREQMFAEAKRLLGGELRQRPGMPGAAGTTGTTAPTGAAGGPMDATAVIAQAETGDPTLGPRALGNISPDKGGSRSYGFMGLNSGSGSAAAFQRQYGAQFGLTAEPGTPQFDAQWKAAAANKTDAFRSAQLQYFSSNVQPNVGASLVRRGIPAQTVADPRVQTYFADRAVQMDTLGLDGAKEAWANARGDVPAFLRNMNAIDARPENLASNFRSTLATGVYSERGHATRLATRLNGALAAGGAGQGAQAATADLNLSPQEQSAYRSAYSDPAQGVTVVGHDGKFYLVPRIINNQPMFDPSDASAAERAGNGIGWDHLKSFDNADEADARVGVIRLAAQRGKAQAFMPTQAPGQPASAAPSAGNDLADLFSKYMTPEHRYYWDNHIETARRASDASAVRTQAIEERQKKEFSKQNEGQLFDGIVAGDPKNPVTQQHLSEAYKSGAIEFDAYKTLTGVLEAHAKRVGGEHDAAEFGNAYYDLLDQIHPAPNSGKQPITDPSWVRDQYASLARTGGLTEKGAHQLIQFMKGDKEHDTSSINDAKAGLRDYAKNVMGNMEDQPGLGKIYKNQKGVNIFDSQFRPLFEQRYEQWMKDPKHDPWEFLSRENVDKVIDEIYPEGKRKADSLFSPHPGDEQKTQTEQPGFFSRMFGGTPAEKLPDAPEGVAAQGWQSVMGRRPNGQNGQPMAADAWAKRVNALVSDPSPETIAAFNERYGNAGFSADDVLHAIGPGTANAPPAAGATPPWPGEPGGPPAPAPQPAQPAQAASATPAAAPAPVEWKGDPARYVGDWLGAHAPESVKRSFQAAVSATKSASETRRQFDEQHILEAKAREEHERPAQLEEELRALDTREDALKRSGLGGAFRDAQMKRIADQRAVLEAEKKNGR